MIAWKAWIPWLKKPLVRRAPRVRLGALDNCWLLYQQDNLLQKCEIQNLSTGGLSFAPNKYFQFDNNTEHEVQINLGEKRIKTKILVLYQNSDFIGAKFCDSESIITAEIYEFLKVQLSAHTLIPVNSKFLSHNHRTNALWLTDGKSNEIFCHIEGDVVIDFQFSFLGNHIAGGQDKELVFGRAHYRHSIEPWIEWSSLDSRDWKYTIPKMCKLFIGQVASLSEKQKKLLENAIDLSLSKNRQ